MSFKSFPHPSKIQKGISSARSNDIKSLKDVVLDWITLRHALGAAPLLECQDEQSLSSSCYQGPSLPHWFRLEGYGVSSSGIFFDAHNWFSVHTKLASRELIVCGDQWPILVYANQEYDSENPWNGLFRSRLLIWMSFVHSCVTYVLLVLIGQVYKHIFTSSSSVEKKVKATRSGNARISVAAAQETVASALVSSASGPSHVCWFSSGWGAELTMLGRLDDGWAKSWLSKLFVMQPCGAACALMSQMKTSL